MGITILDAFFSTPDTFQEIELADADLYTEYAPELSKLHTIGFQPDEQVVGDLMAKISLLTMSAS
ncbi:MAG: hypothetical protein EOP54_13685 [Sphingobacteriales bacterium]|nr:MAG: hypothetical protein EOP54_13685 [Sphingobacteriales bacterium]